MLRHGFKNFKRWFFRTSTIQPEVITIMTPELTPEYLETLKQEYQYVSTCLNYSTQKFKLLTNQGLNPQVLQQVNNAWVVKKAELEVQIYAITDYLNS